MKRSLLFLYITILSGLFVCSHTRAQTDKHDSMLCNCKEIHRHGNSDYAHEHNNDGWMYYRFQSFDRQPWRAYLGRDDEDGKFNAYPLRWNTVTRKRQYISNGSCDDLKFEKTSKTVYVDSINHTFTGSIVKRASWEQLDETDVTVSGTSKIGAKSSADLRFGSLEGSQEFAVTSGVRVHSALTMSEEFEASKTVSNHGGQEISREESDKISAIIRPCKVGILESTTFLEHYYTKYYREPHETTCKYEGTFWDTHGHKTVCPQGVCELEVTGKRSVRSTAISTRRPLTTDKEDHILPDDFECDDCGKDATPPSDATLSPTPSR